MECCLDVDLNIQKVWVLSDFFKLTYKNYQLEFYFIVS